MVEKFSPGTLVDIYAPYDRHRFTWVTGYQIFNPKESSKERHKRLTFKTAVNPLTGEIEECYAVRSGAFVFPVVKSHVRKSSKDHIDLWNPEAFKGSGVVLKGFVVADESDKEDLRSLDDFSVADTDMEG